MELHLATSEETQQLRSEVAPIVQYAREIQIEAPEVYQEAANNSVVIAAIKKKINDKFDPAISQAFQAHKSICKIKNDILAPLKAAEKILKGKIGFYLSAKEREQRQAELKARQEAEEKQRKLDEQARKKAEKLRAKGNKESAQEVLNNVPQVPVKPVEPIVPKVEGIKKRVDWKAEITDETKIPRKYMIPDEKALNQLARGTKGSITVPGVRFYPQDVIMAGR